jgi:murein DD-endopeptidase MepM/ murein hydrolase activator NlpD
MAFPKPAVASAGLKKGAKSDQVKWIQEALNLTQGTKIGYTGNGYNYSGVFDDTLEKYVKDFQKKYGLTQDGIFGPASLKKMEELLKAEEDRKKAIEEAAKKKAAEDAKKAEEAKANEKFQNPLGSNYKIGTKNSARDPKAPGNWSFGAVVHRGIDILAPAGTQVRPTLSGKVTHVGTETNGGSGKSWGNRIVIDHGQNFTSFYGSLDKMTCKVGDLVTQNTVIGTVSGTLCEDCKRFGSTASALHFSIYYARNAPLPKDDSEDSVDKYFGTRLNQYKGGNRI